MNYKFARVFGVLFCSAIGLNLLCSCSTAEIAPKKTARMTSKNETGQCCVSNPPSLATGTPNATGTSNVVVSRVVLSDARLQAIAVDVVKNNKSITNGTPVMIQRAKNLNQEIVIVKFLGPPLHNTELDNEIASVVLNATNGHVMFVGHPLQGPAITKADPVKDMDTFINNARSALLQKNLPVGDRTPETMVENGEVVISFPLVLGEQKGSYIVRMDKETGTVIGIKIWR